MSLLRAVPPALIGLLMLCSPTRGNDLEKTVQDAVSRYRAQLIELADWCDQRGLKEQGERTRFWASPRSPAKIYVAVLPKEEGSLRTPEGATGDLAEWHTRFAGLRTKQASVLFELARRAVVGNRHSLAVDLVLTAIREDPDHAACRRLLGYQASQGQWCTAFEARRHRTGYVWHEKFGWLPRNHVTRYEQGMRNFNGRWVTAEEEARLRRDIRSGWDIETEHYKIRTNHSLEAGVQLGVKLEELNRVWRQLFVRYYLTEQQVSDLFAGRARNRGDMPQHSIVYFRDRDDYVRALQPAIPNIEITVGVYVENISRAYFFAGKDYDERTLLHEATHQLFHETRRVPLGIGAKSNFWIVEGVALYMETLHEENGFHVLGGWDDIRVQAARYRLLHDNFYVSLSDFTAYGRARLQGDPRIATLYSQAAGLSHFLVHYDGGRYRDALVNYLSLVYSGQDNSTTLVRLAGVPYTELDRQYREYMEGAPVAAPKAVEEPAAITTSADH